MERMAGKGKIEGLFANPTNFLAVVRNMPAEKYGVGLQTEFWSYDIIIAVKTLLLDKHLRKFS